MTSLIESTQGYSGLNMARDTVIPNANIPLTFLLHAGADIDNICREAALISLKENIDAEYVRIILTFSFSFANGHRASI